MRRRAVPGRSWDLLSETQAPPSSPLRLVCGGGKRAGGFLAGNVVGKVNSARELPRAAESQERGILRIRSQGKYLPSQDSGFARSALSCGGLAGLGLGLRTPPYLPAAWRKGAKRFRGRKTWFRCSGSTEQRWPLIESPTLSFLVSSLHREGVTGLLEDCELESVPVDRLARKACFQHPALTVPTLPGLYWTGRSASSNAAVCHPPSWGLSYFHVKVARSLGATATACPALQVPPGATPVSLWPLNHAAASSDKRRKKPAALSPSSLSLLQQSGRQPEKAQYVRPTFPAASTHPSRGGQDEGEERLQTTGSWAAPLLRSLGSPLEGGGGRGTLKARVQRERAPAHFLSLSPPPTLNQKMFPNSQHCSSLWVAWGMTPFPECWWPRPCTWCRWFTQNMRAGWICKIPFYKWGNWG